MRIVAALGGNALLRRGEPLTSDRQMENLAVAAASLAPLITAGHEVVISHGNGPQVGLLALLNEAVPESAFDLDVLGAETQGMIGYQLQQALDNVLSGGHLLATIITRVLVDARDEAFHVPAKPIGPVYDEQTARRLASKHRWQVARDGEHWRRIVPSPLPVRILEARVISLMLEKAVTVVCSGGGGVPVIETSEGIIRGVEAVVDKDLSSALLARQLGADFLLLLTDVDAVYHNWRTSNAHAIRRAKPSDFNGLSFERGTMQPKVDAAVGFVNETGKRAGVGALRDAGRILAGEAGTLIALR